MRGACLYAGFFSQKVVGPGRVKTLPTTPVNVAAMTTSNREELKRGDNKLSMEIGVNLHFCENGPFSHHSKGCITPKKGENKSLSGTAK